MAGKKQAGILVEADWSRGIIRDLPRTAMPSGTCYDSTDFLLHRQGEAVKRGGTAYFGPEVSASVSTILDSSANAHLIDVQGDTVIDSAVHTLGTGSVAFDGSGDYLTLDGSDDFAFGGGDFTVDFRLRLSALPATTARLYDSRAAALGITATNKIGEHFTSTASCVTTTILSPTANTLYLCSVAVPDNKTVSSVSGCGLTWTLVTSKSQGTFHLYVYRGMESTGLSDGAVTVTLSGATVDATRVAVDEFMGVDTGGSHGSRAIVQSATAGSSSATSLTVTLAAFEGTASVGFGAFMKSGGVPTVANGYTALYSNSTGPGDAIMTEYKAADDDPKVTFSGPAVSAGIGIELRVATYPLISVTSAGKVTFTAASAALTALLTSTTTLSTATWYHVAVVRNGGTTSLYINGVSESSSTDTHTYASAAERPTINSSGTTLGSETAAGWIDELRVSNSARWTTGFTPSASAYTDDANTMLLIHGDTNVTSATALRSSVYADFPTGGHLFVTADDNHLYRVVADNTTDLGSVGSMRIAPICKPVLHVSGTSRLILPANDGVTGPYAYDGTTVGLLDATAPGGKIAGIFKARLILANTDANPNRLFFSPLDPSGTWDTATAWVDIDHEVTGLANIRNTMLVFSSGHTDYVTGSVPPGTDGFDMALGPLGDIGCSDARSIDTWSDSVVFANTNGVYMTNGAAFRNLTEPQEFGFEGLGDYWRSLLADHTSSWQIHGGVLGDFYIVTIRDASDTLVETLMCYLPRRAWMRLTNFDAGMYASRSANRPELYYSARDATRCVAVSGIFTPDGTNKNDADGTPVEPTLTTRFLGSGPVLKAYGFGRLTYDLRDSGDVPDLAVQLAVGAEAPTLVDVAESPLVATLDATRSRFTLNKDSQGVTLKFAQQNPSASTTLFALEVEERPYSEVVDGSS